MAKTVDISLDSVQQLLEQIQDYFMGITLYQQIAWGAIGLGAILILVGVIVW